MIEADAPDLLDRTMVVTSGNASGPTASDRLIVIADVDEGEAPDLGGRRNITGVRPYPKGRLHVREALQRPYVPSETFRSELETMGFPRAEAESLALKAGHSVPVLRRRHSNDPEIRRPPWARDRVSAKLRLAFALAGSWVERENNDGKSVLQLRGEIAEGEVRSARDDLPALTDAPAARYGDANGVVSALHVLFAVGPYIEREDLDRFFQLQPELDGDRDPSLDLPRGKWRMAHGRGHASSHARAPLSGPGNALCILSYMARTSAATGFASASHTGPGRWSDP